MRRKKREKPEDSYYNEEYKEPYICKNCGREISERDFFEHDGLCRYCRPMTMQRGFPGLPGFPKM